LFGGEQELEVKINKEIRDYTEGIFFGLNMRQLIFSAIAVAAAVGTYFSLRNVLGTEIVSWLCIIAAAPFAAMGFIKYNGLTAEQFAWAWLKSEVLYPRRYSFKANNLYYNLMKGVDGKYD